MKQPLRISALASLLLLGSTGVPALVHAQSSSAAGSTDAIQIAAVSTRADRISGGSVLVRITLPAGRSGRPRLTLNGSPLASQFRSEGSGSYLGMVGPLALGANELVVDGDAWGVPDRSITLTNYPLMGPIVSGPHIEPFFCQTAEFELPDGSSLGTPAEANCSAPTRVQYVYKTTTGDDLQPLPAGNRLPADVAMTTTTSGRRVPFVVRVETGTMNRGIYQNAVLHNPVSDPAPTPSSPPPGWNRRLIAVHGTGCPTGWYRQGGALGVNPLTGANLTRLGEGYGVFTNTLNHPTNSCNAYLAGETTMMGKEHFIETFGVPSFTVSIGTSGGAYTGLQVADAFPGLIDGVIALSTFPDALSIAVAGLDAHLLTRYFAVTRPGRFSDEQKVAITGYQGVVAFEDAANQAQRTDPVPDRQDVEGYASARWHDAVPAASRYHPQTNPTGARPTVFDAARNIYGVHPATGFAVRPFDNVGVQYGLAALNAGAITVDDFLDLNEAIGGYDHDANYVAARSAGDEGAIRRTYQSGVTLGGGGGLAGIPVMDAGGYNEERAYHYQWFHFAVRERMRLANGNANNHVMWRGQVSAPETWRVMTEWLSEIHEGDESRPSPVAAKPAAAVDGCWVRESEDAPARFIAEPQTFSSSRDTACNEEYPSYGFVRQVAGGPLHANILKCQLKPVDGSDYAVPMNAEQMTRLRRIFSAGVCDWSRPGVGQVPVQTWSSFGPAPGSLAAE